MSITKRRMLAVALAASVAAGCGQGSSSSTSNPPPSGKASARTLLAAAQNTTSTGSAKFAMHMSMTSAGGTVTMQGTGEATFKHPAQMAMTMVMNVPQAGRPLSLSERLIGTTIYMKMPFLSAHIPGGKTWFKLDLEAMGRMSGMDFGSLMNSGSQNPAAVLAYLQGVSSDIQNRGTQTIDGVQTTHYQATVSLPRMIARLQKVDPRAVPTYRQIMQRSGMRMEPIEVWIDGHGLLRRETVHSRMPLMGASMSFTMDLSDYGVPVNVSAPPASQTMDFLQLLKQHAQSSSGGA